MVTGAVCPPAPLFYNNLKNVLVESKIMGIILCILGELPRPTYYPLFI